MVLKAARLLSVLVERRMKNERQVEITIKCLTSGPRARIIVDIQIQSVSKMEGRVEEDPFNWWKVQDRGYF